MAQIVQLRELQAQRERAQRRVGERQSLARAVAIMRDNLASVALLLKDAPPREQPELLDRVEKLAAMIRYGIRFLGYPGDETDSANSLR
jgi:hypothetical protein